MVRDECFLSELKPSCVLELGGGRSTLFLAEYAMGGRGERLHYTIEHDARWVSKLNWNLQEAHMHHFSKILYAPIVNDWYDINYIRSQIPEKIDMLFIDGPPGDSRKSPRGQQFIDELVESNELKLVVIDDTHREENDQFSKYIWSKLGGDYLRFSMKYGFKVNKIHMIFSNQARERLDKELAFLDSNSGII